mmetsp:Transcript_39519/g.62487  ORF Transcript_39519/g.62487 Transcript_39519/m.62487 type:complete len:214 (+) Transcript_39519:38-679(+)
MSSLLAYSLFSDSFVVSTFSIDPEGLIYSDYQDECMKRLIGHRGQDMHLFLRHVGLLRTHTYYLNVCTWEGVTCEQQIVRQIAWACLRKEFVGNSSWMSNSTITFHAYNSAFQSPFVTRHLPQYLEVCRITYSKITGSLDIHQLPKSLKILELQGNRFEGTVSIFDIPPEMMKINIKYNAISEVQVHRGSSSCEILYEEQDSGTAKYVEIRFR